MRDVAERHLREAPGVKIDYLALVDPETFAAIDGQTFSAGGAEASPSDGSVTMQAGGAPSKHGRGLLAVAAWVGPTRLIDNMEVELRG